MLRQTQKRLTSEELFKPYVPPNTPQLTPQQLIKKYSDYDLDMSKVPFTKYFDTHNKPVGAKLTIPELSHWQMVHKLNYPYYVYTRRL